VLSGAATEELDAKFGGDVRLLRPPVHLDRRGRLTEFDFSVVPFGVERAFTVSDVPVGTTRGGHSHRTAAQVLACVSGRVEVDLRRDNADYRLVLTPDSGALYITPGVWARQRYADEGTVLVVLASEPYDPAGYETGP